MVGGYDDSDDNAGNDGADSKLPSRTRSKTGSKLFGDYDDNGDNAGDDGADSKLPPTTRSKNAKRYDMLLKFRYDSNFYYFFYLFYNICF